jgi:Uncharacterized protein conserved in bacteria
MSRHYRKVALAFCFSALLITAWMRLALADGGIFPIVIDIPLGVGHSADQRAILVFDPETKTQTMVLSTMYVGQPTDFAWVIPVPNLPSRDQITVWEGGEFAFWELFDKTEPRLQTRLQTSGVGLVGCSGCGYASNAPGQPSEPTEPGFVGVKVVDQLQIKGLDIALLKAQSAADLTGWLNTNGYRFPDGAVNVLEHYIGKGWDFVAVKVDTPDEESQSMPPSPPPLWRGYFPRNPLKLTFRTDRCVFPMRISSVSSHPSGSAVLIYVFAPYRVRAGNFPTVEMKPPSLTTNTLADFRFAYQEAFQKLLNQPQGRALVVEYAKPFLGQDFGEFTRSLLVPWQTYYLTRLRTIFRPEHMTDDIVFVPNETNEVVDVIIIQPQFHARLWKWSLVLGLATFWFGIRRRQKTVKKEALLVGILTALALGGL